jgi:hypothetical protein
VEERRKRKTRENITACCDVAIASMLIATTRIDNDLDFTLYIEAFVLSSLN